MTSTLKKYGIITYGLADWIKNKKDKKKTQDFKKIEAHVIALEPIQRFKLKIENLVYRFK